jgi:mono/diheme cytochrome c family protein
MKILGKLAIAGASVFVILQAIRPSIPTQSATAEIQAPPAVLHILQKDCYSCHSSQRRLSWFDQIVPGYWLVRHDVLTARQHLNFETIGAKPAAAQRATLFEAVNMIQLGAMPLPQFVSLHPEARVSQTDLATLKAYLAPWSPLPPAAPAPTPAPLVNLAAVPPEFNGVPFDPTFESWRLMDATDRGDNNTFRFILGNDIAYNAAKSGTIKPWPDGAEFAKVTWQKTTGPDGLVHIGNFVQVELMEKDAARYKHSQGWGYGRWRGLDLKPYGKDAAFVTECTSCHQPVSGNDYVYTQLITTAQVPGTEIVNNAAAALPANLPFQPLGWHPITQYVDPATHTMATLFGNVIASRSIQARGALAPESPATATYQPGSVLALVTWSQREDPHWFGARIPDAPQSVEFVSLAPGTQPAAYRTFTGPGLAEFHPAPPVADQRTTFVLNLPPARVP